ncbi:thiamine phosphate synthase [Candidatus Omnitrophota bacterium]
MFEDYSLYFVAGQDSSLGRSSLEVVETALSGGVDVVQMREKDLGGDDILSLGEKLAALCRQKNATFIINDDPLLAREVGADGVHLGQEDLLRYPLDKTRDIIGNKIIGVSTHSFDQFNLANKSNVDYIAYGPIFPTKTKDYFIGTDDIEGIVKIAAKPVVFIGGIDLENIDQILDRGGKNIAVIRAISQAKDIRDKVERLKGIISEKKKAIV